MEPVITVKDTKECCTSRNVLWYLVFIGFAVNYMIRLNLNIALVSMIQPKPKNAALRGECDVFDANMTVNAINLNVTEQNLYSSTTQNSIIMNESSTSMMDGSNVTQFLSIKTKRAISTSDRMYFDWNEKEQGYILGSYFWLHWTTQIPGGILATKYGTKQVFGWSNFLGVVGCYLIPWFAHQGTFYLVFIRCLQGLICGFCWPAMHNMVSKWIPPNERSKFVTAYMGSSVGAGITYPLCGFIIDRWGWEMVFYSSGILGTLWFLAWWWLVHDSPSQHPRISLEEKQYILHCLGKSVSKKTLPTPWKAILTDKPLWTNVIAQIGGLWGLFTLTVNGPSYFKFIHGWNIRATGILSGMPHFFRVLFAYLFSILGDYLLRTNKMKRTNVRKFATLICCGVQGIFMLGLAYSGCNKSAAIVFMTLAVASHGTVSSGPLASLVDISPNYSSILLGICNTLVSILGFITPAVVGFFTYQNQITLQWQKVYWVCTVMLFSSCVYYLIFSSSELAPWNTPADEENNKTETEMMVIKNSQNAKENKKEKTKIEQITYSDEAIY